MSVAPVAPPARSARQAYRDRLLALMARDPSVVCLDTDTGLFAGADFGTAADRYFNLGIAEHNLMTVAAGMAASGLQPFVNTMASFAATRVAEAVKVDIAYNALPVRIMATHSGVSAGHLGPTHHSLEDLAVMRTLPNMTVVVPGDEHSTESLFDQVLGVPGPVYMRFGRKSTPALPAGAADPVLGRLQPLAGRQPEVMVVATGPLPVSYALVAARAVTADGTEVGVLQAHTVKPFDAAGLLRRVAGARLVVTVEEHWRSGGLGSLVAETLAEATADRPAPRLVRLGLPDAFVGTVGTQEELLSAAGVSPDGIAATIRRELLVERGRTRT